MDNTDYDEEREVNLIASRKMRGSVMNIALPSQEEKKQAEISRQPTNKRKRSEMDAYQNQDGQKDMAFNNIRKAFESHGNSDAESLSRRGLKRMKIADDSEVQVQNYDEKGNRSCLKMTAETSREEREREDEDAPMRKLSISNFEPIQPMNLSKPKSTFEKEAIQIYGTPQPNRSESMAFNQLVFKNNSYFDDYHINPENLFRKPKNIPDFQLNEPQSGDQCEENPRGKIENRLSFDF